MDILTGKQLLFAEPMIKRLERENSILCTTRHYRELDGLVKIRGIKAMPVGMHGGKANLSKLICSARRVERLAALIDKFRPDVVVSFQSPDAARVAFGLGIRHVGFADSAHATAVMRLTIPYLDTLLIPWIMKKGRFVRYGISEKNILKYRSIDAAITCRRRFSKRLRLKNDSKIIVVRTAEEQASYNKFPDSGMTTIIEQLLKHLPKFRVVIMARYARQIKLLKERFGEKIIVIRGVPDGMDVLRYADVFIGSGGTMTAEAAFLGIPTISYSGRQDYEVDAFLEKEKIIVRESDPAKIPHIVERLINGDGAAAKTRAEKLLNTMQDPFLVLQKAIK